MLVEEKSFRRTCERVFDAISSKDAYVWLHTKAEERHASLNVYCIEKLTLEETHKLEDIFTDHVILIYPGRDK